MVFMTGSPQMTLACPWGLVTTRPNLWLWEPTRLAVWLGRKRYGFPKAFVDHYGQRRQKGTVRALVRKSWNCNVSPMRSTSWKYRIIHPTSKWKTRIKHWLLLPTELQLSAIPLETLEIVVNLIGSTKTNKGLEVHVGLMVASMRKDAKSATLNSRRSTSSETHSMGTGTMRSTLDPNRNHHYKNR